MILPMIDVPVSLVGTFAVMAVMGFSLNNLTLFGMVLAIGIVVDDAIVVLENVERQMSYGLDAKTATIKAMAEITGPIVAITLVLCSVFRAQRVHAGGHRPVLPPVRPDDFRRHGDLGHQRDDADAVAGGGDLRQSTTRRARPPAARGPALVDLHRAGRGRVALGRQALLRRVAGSGSRLRRSGSETLLGDDLRPDAARRDPRRRSGLVRHRAGQRHARLGVPRLQSLVRPHHRTLRPDRRTHGAAGRRGAGGLRRAAVADHPRHESRPQGVHPRARPRLPVGERPIARLRRSRTDPADHGEGRPHRAGRSPRRGQPDRHPRNIAHALGRRAVVHAQRQRIQFRFVLRHPRIVRAAARTRGRVRRRRRPRTAETIRRRDRRRPDPGLSRAADPGPRQRRRLQTPGRTTRLRRPRRTPGRNRSARGQREPGPQAPRRLHHVPRRHAADLSRHRPRQVRIVRRLDAGRVQHPAGLHGRVLRQSVQQLRTHLASQRLG